MKDYAILECDLASIRLPQDCEIGQPLPRLSAKLEQGMIALDLKVDDLIWSVMRKHLDQSLPVNPQRELSLVRRGSIQSPYEGTEEIVQARVLANNVLFFTWDLLLEHNNHRAIVNVFGHGRFFDSESFWQQIIDSFRFK